MRVPMCLRRAAAGAALIAAGLAAALNAAAPAMAQEWPTRNVTVVVPLGAGSASDVMARVVMDQVGKQLGQTFVIENRPGAGGTTVAGMVAKSAPDGYTLVMGAVGSFAVNPTLYSKLPFDVLRDFAPISQVLVMASIVAVNNE